MALECWVFMLGALPWHDVGVLLCGAMLHTIVPLWCFVMEYFVVHFYVLQGYYALWYTCCSECYAL